MGDGSKVYVLDASFVLSFLLQEENRPQEVDTYFERQARNTFTFIAPELLRLEVIHGLRSSFLRERSSIALVRKIYSQFEQLKIAYREIDHGVVLELAMKEKVSAYDAAYVFLSQTHGAPLLSLDKQLMTLLHGMKKNRQGS